MDNDTNRPPGVCAADGCPNPTVGRRLCRKHYNQQNQTADPTCRNCAAPETRCAYLGGACCADCSHWRHLDHNGNELDTAVCGTDAGYQRHRYRHEPTCIDCRRAHLEANRRKEAS